MFVSGGGLLKKKKYVINKKQGGREGIKKCVMISGEKNMWWNKEKKE